MKKISIIIPTFNEEKTISTIIRRVDKVSIEGFSKEILIIDDGSTDETCKILTKLCDEIANIRVFRHAKNSGKGSAVRTGIRNATGEIILIQDADLEYNPEDIPKLIAPIIENTARVVYGTRLRMKPVYRGKAKTPLLLNFFCNKFLSFLTSIIYGQTISDMETGYKAFDKSSLQGIKLTSRSFDFEPEITAKILKKGVRIKEIDIRTTPRGYDEGKKIRPIHDGLIALWTLVKYRFTN